MKLVLKILGGIVLVVVLALVILTQVIDPNDYKPQIQQQVKTAINRDLVIEGDISWSLWPSLGFELGPVQLKNPAGFNRENLMEIQHTAAAIELLPLLGAKVQLGEINLNGFRLHLITKADGSSNLDGMSPEKSKTGETPAEPTKQSTTPALADLSIGGLVINDTQVEIQDLATAQTTKLDVEEISLGRLALGHDSPLRIKAAVDLADLDGQLELNANVNIAKAMDLVALKNIQLNSKLAGAALPKETIQLSVTGEMAFDIIKQAIALDNFQLSADDIELAGQLNAQLGVIPTVRFNLKGNEWDLDPWMPPAPAEAQPEEPTAPATEPDLSVLKQLDVEGELTIAAIKAQGLTLSDVLLKLDIGQGKLIVSPLFAKLYQGTLNVEATIDEAAGQNTYQVNKVLQGVQIQPLLEDLAGKPLISGATHMSVKVSGAGLTPEKVKAKMAGGGNFEFTDGALYGINIPQKIRNIKAMFKGEAGKSDDSAEKTDFSSMKGQFTIGEGQVNNTELTMMSPMLRIDGQGIANLLQENLDYNLSVAVVGSLEGQQGEQADDLSKLTLPLAITGPWADPKFRLQTDSALKANLDEKKDKLEEKAKEQLKKKLGNFFGN